MSNIKTIFKKELKDVLRDRRTVYAMILAPVLIYPLLITSFTQVMKIQNDKAAEKVLQLGIIGDYVPQEFIQIADQQGKNLLVKNIPNDSAIISSLVGDSLDAVFVFPPDLRQRLDSMDKSEISVYYRTAQDDVSARLDALLSVTAQLYSHERMQKLNLIPEQINPITYNRIDLSSSREKIGQSVGAMVPYFFMIFCFLGCMYPAIDLGAGEKERGTMETLLSSPANRIEIFLGKFGVVALGGMISAVLALGSLAVSIKINSDSFGELPPEITSSLSSMVNPSTLVLLFLLLLPLTAFFASALLTLSILSKSFKEAQSVISPMMILVMLPTFIGFIPGLQLSIANAWIPIFNVSLASRDIIAGTIETAPFLVAVISLFLLAGSGILISLRFFKSEKNMLPS